MPSIAKLLSTLGGIWPIWLPLVVGGLAIFLLLPRPRQYPILAGGFVGVLALVLAGVLLVAPGRPSADVQGLIEGVLFYAFSGLAILGGALLVTQHNPARAALSFTLVVLSTCGLFLLLAAPFLFAATIIIYAGAIIVTFLFVLMLAQQAGLSDADARSREPLLATVTGFLLLVAILFVLRGYQPSETMADLLARIDRAMAEETREAMSAHVEPGGPGREKDRDDRHLFRQATNLLETAGLADAARKARHAGDEWTLADSIAEEPVKQSELALRKLREVLVLEQDRLMVARLPGSEEDTRGRKVPPLSALSGPPPTTRAEEIRRDAGTGRPRLPAENSAYLGRSLFTDYLLPVELGGTLLLVATIGAIVIAHRRTRQAAGRTGE